MAEIKGYFLTEEEEKACMALVKKMREKKVFTIGFSGTVQVKATTSKEAHDIFWKWVLDLRNKSLTDWSGIITQSPYFENKGIKFENKIVEEE